MMGGVERLAGPLINISGLGMRKFQTGHVTLAADTANRDANG